MDKRANQTIFTRLNNIFGPEGVKVPKADTNRYNINNKELIRTTDKGEYEQAKKQALQNAYLSNQWQKVDNEMYQQSMHYETTRIASYSDFEAMEFFPEIAAALDVFMEEASTPNDKGQLVNIYSDSKRVKEAIEDLLFKRLDIHTTLPMWIRNLPIREDSIIPLLDGTETTIKELSNRIKSNEEIWTYSIHKDTNTIVPGKIIWCDLTRKNSELVRVTLDDGTHLDTTPDHQYMLRDGSYLRADELTNGQSLMPFYTNISDEGDNILGYEKIYNPGTNRYRYTHRIVALNTVVDLEKEKKCDERFLSHHVDFNKRNNLPNNLLRLTISEHTKLHNKLTNNLEIYRSLPDVIEKRMLGIDKYLRSDERKERLSKEMSGIYPKYFKNYNNSELHSKHNKIRSEKMNSNWSDEEFINKTRNGMTISINDKCLEYISNIIKNNDSYIGVKALSNLLILDSKFIELLSKTYTLRKDIKKSINQTTLNNIIVRKTNKSYIDFVISIKPSLISDKKYIKAKSICLGMAKSKALINHKVISVEKLTEMSDVYCMEVVGPNNEQDRHNFPVCSKNNNGEYTRNGVFLSNCKYGDNFLMLNLDSAEGVIGARQMPNFEMERREGDLVEMLRRTNDDKSSEYDNKVRFYWKGKNIEFNSWQIAHFRLLSDTRKLPYGSSILEKARRIWKQLLMAEDAMLVYRITRAPERRVYKVFVGNIDDADVPAYVNQIANKFKRTPAIDPQTGQMDLRYNQMPVWRNSPIPLLDGRTITIEELAKEYDNGKENYVYSVKDKTHEIVGGKVVWCGKNYTAEQMVKVWLDDDTYIVTAPEHPFIMRDGSKKRADELNEEDSLMPFYQKLSTKTDGMKIEGYPMVYNPQSGKYIFTHRIIGEEFLAKEKLDVHKNTNWLDNNNLTIHHKDFNKTNSNPNNLQWIGNIDHIVIHGTIGGAVLTKYNKSEKKRLRNIELAKEQNWGDRFIAYNHSELHTEHNKIRSKAQKEDWSNPEKKELRSKCMQINFDSFTWESIRTNIINDKITNRKTLIEFLNSETVINHVISINTNKRLINKRKIDRTVIERLLVEKGFKTITDYISENRKNHKVKSIEFIGGDDVYCMTVVGPNGEDDRHNFATLSFKTNGEVSVSGSLLGNSNDQDYFIPVRSENSPNPIDTLPGASNLDQIQDILMLQRKLCTALRVPKTFLGFDEPTGEGKNLALQDIRFSRTVNRIQQAIIMELNKIIIIHLSMLGFDDDLGNFTITLNNPSTQAEMLKIEHLQAKVSLYAEAVRDAGNGFAPMSMTRAKREILGMSNDEIKQDLLEQRIEKAAAAELEVTAKIIKHTGFFDTVDDIYGIPKEERDKAMAQGGAEGGDEPGGPDAAGGFGGGGGFGGEELDLNTEEGGEESTSEEAGSEESPDFGGEEATPEEFGGEETAKKEESFIKKSNKILREQKAVLQKKLDARSKKYNDIYVNRLINSIGEDSKPILPTKMHDKTMKVNESINGMISDIDKMIGE